MPATSPDTIQLPSFRLTEKNDTIKSEDNYNFIFAFIVLHVAHGRNSTVRIASWLNASSSGDRLRSRTYFSGP